MSFKNKIVVLLILGFSNSAFAQEYLVNITQGHWNLGGSMDLSKNSNSYWRNQAHSTFSFSFLVKYFLKDGLSLGLEGDVEVYDSPGFHSFTSTIGPSFSYYFWKTERLVAQVTTGFRVGLTESSVQSILQLKLGAEYFVTPSVSVGPSLYYERHHQSGVGHNTYGLLGGINFYF